MSRSLDTTRHGVRLHSAARETAGSRTPQLENTLFTACGLAWSASLIHVQAAVQHLGEYLLFAVFFVVLAGLQFAWAVAVCRGPTRPLLRAGAVGSLLVAGLWLTSRTTGLPIGPEPWHPESVGALDSIATADELVTALLVFFPRGLGINGKFQRGSKYLAVAFGVSLIVVSSLTLVAGGHTH